MKLIPAFAADPARLSAAYHAFLASGRSADYQLDSWLTLFKAPEDDWQRIARVATAEDGRYVGILSAYINRDVRSVTQLAAVRFELGGHLDVAWAATLRTWMRGLIDQFEVIHWTARRGSHNAEMWTRAALGLGGRVVGYQRNAGRTPAGGLVDMELYEVPGRGGRGPTVITITGAGMSADEAQSLVAEAEIAQGGAAYVSAVAHQLSSALAALGALDPAAARIAARELSEELARMAEESG